MAGIGLYVHRQGCDPSPEALGALGRGEGIGALAVALLRR